MLTCKRNIAFPLLLVAVSIAAAWGQTGRWVSGRVVDSATREPLPFVHILINNNPGRGEVTGLDGQFKLRLYSTDSVLVAKYVGYANTRVLLSPSKDQYFIPLARAGIQLAEVEVKAGENPANRIIRAVINHRKENNPLLYDNFSYKAYDKLIMSSGQYLKEEVLAQEDSSWLAKMDSLAASADSVPADSGDTGASLLDSTYLFLMETVSSRNFRGPGKDVTRVLGTRASGIKMPELFVLATQFQPFTFYEDHIRLAGQHYVNPLVPGTFNRYFFHLQDTLYDGPDSIFVLSFRPRKGRPDFNGLQGVLYIHTHRYGVQHLMASPVSDSLTAMRMNIQQSYQRINGRWFPEQLHTDITFPFIWLDDGPAVATARSYLTAIRVNSASPEKERSRFALQVLPGATLKEEEWWQQYRKDSLTLREQNTYIVIDSLSKAYGVERKLNWALALSRGYLRTGILDWPMEDWLRFNNYEGFRPGLGVRTNDLLSSRFRLEAFGAYGTRDKAFKYGGAAAVKLWPAADWWLKAAYHREVFEVGRYAQWISPAAPTWSQRLRDYYVDDMFTESAFTVSTRFRPFSAWQVAPYYRVGTWESPDNYALSLNALENVTVGQSRFDVQEAGIRIQWVPGQSLAYVNGKVNIMQDQHPRIWLTYYEGWGHQGTMLRYRGLEGKFHYTHRWRNNAMSYIDLSAGWQEGALPYYRQFMPLGTKANNNIYVIEGAFHTMPIHTYLANRFVSSVLRHNFGALLPTKGFFQPKLAVQLGGYWGGIWQQQQHLNTPYRTAPLGYYEGGLILHDLITYGSFLGLRPGFGVGAFYRFGPYAVPKWQDNFAIRLAVQVGL